MKSKYLLLLISFAVITLSLSSCSDNDNPNPQTNSVVGKWKIKSITANVETNNSKATAAIKKSIEEAQFLTMFKLIEIEFEKENKFNLYFDITEGNQSDWEPAVAFGESEEKENVLVIKKITSIDLGGLKDLVPMFVPGIQPDMLDKLPEMANAFLPFYISLKEVDKNERFVGVVPIGEMYNADKIAAILEEQEITDVDPAKVEVKTVDVIVTCNAFSK